MPVIKQTDAKQLQVINAIQGSNPPLIISGILISAHKIQIKPNVK